MNVLSFFRRYWFIVVAIIVLAYLGSGSQTVYNFVYSEKDVCESFRLDKISDGYDCTPCEFGLSTWQTDCTKPDSVDFGSGSFAGSGVVGTWEASKNVILDNDDDVFVGPVKMDICCLYSGNGWVYREDCSVLTKDTYFVVNDIDDCLAYSKKQDVITFDYCNSQGKCIPVSDVSDNEYLCESPLYDTFDECYHNLPSTRENFVVDMITGNLQGDKTEPDIYDSSYVNPMQDFYNTTLFYLKVFFIFILGLVFVGVSIFLIFYIVKGIKLFRRLV